MEYNYLIYCRNPRNRAVIKFTTLSEGTVVFRGNGVEQVGFHLKGWHPHNDGEWLILSPLELNALETTHGIPIIRKV